MINANDLYDKTIKDGTTPEEIIYLYITQRLQVLNNRKDFDKAILNVTVEFIADNFINNDYSVDKLIDAYITYINTHNEYPMAIMLNDDALALLQDYSDEEF